MSGLRSRMVLAIGATVLLTLAVAFAVVYRQTGSELRAQLNVALHSDAAQLGDTIREHPAASPRQALRLARSFARAQPYSRAAVLLYAIVPGYGTASNHPELFGPERSDDHESLSEQRVENAEGRRLAQPRPGYAQQPAPDTGTLVTYETAVPLSGGLKLYAGAAAPTAQIARAQSGVLHSYARAAILAVALALLAAFFAGSRMAAPLRRVASTAAEVDGGDLSPRMRIPSSASREVRVLAAAFNHMLDRLRDAFEAQREFVADASHELRTPLTVIRGQLDLLSGAEAVSTEELARVQRIVSSEVARMSRLTDDLLLLAQSGESDFLHREEVALRAFIGELWDGLSLTAERRFEVGPVPDIKLQADPDRIAQALRNLARNAIQHTREPDGLVRIDVALLPHAAREHPATVRFTVSDDGPGIAPEQRTHIFERFYRTDPARARAGGGAGLGLAIVKAIADAHGGTVAAGETPDGGAALRLEVPYVSDRLSR